MLIKHAIQALQARSQNWQSRHFEKTKYGKQIAALKDTHRGESCVVVGNGPSLRAEDLQKLHELGIVSFAANRIFNVFDQTQWRPTYYASEDVIILRDIQSIVPTIPAKRHFIPINLHWYEGIDVMDADWFYLDYQPASKEYFGMSQELSHGINCKGTVSITCIQLAVYMGFTKIYLIGMDHNYSRMINEKGEEVIDSSVKDYFSDQYDVGIKDLLQHNVGGMTRSFLEVEALSRKLGTFRVFNATRGGKLEVFERVDFDTVF